MTRRERLEAKLEKRQDWAAKASSRSRQRLDAVHTLASHIPLGQPILIGHHSERHARADQARIQNGMAKGMELAALASHHQGKAAGLQHQLDRSIFSDDSDALEALAERIAEAEAERDKMKKVNTLYRKGDAAGLAALGFNLEALQTRLKDAYSWAKMPYASYELTNAGARIRADKKRLEEITRRQQATAKAEEAPNGVTLEESSAGYCRVTFAEKPERAILQALKDAGFFWNRGSWAGKRDALPAAVAELL